MPSICKQLISNTERCSREVYKDDLCIIHHNSSNKPNNLLKNIIRDDIYRGFYNFSNMISYDGFSFDGLKIEKGSNFNFSHSLFYAPFNINNLSLDISLDFTDALFDSGLFIKMSNISKEIIMKNVNVNMDLNFSLSNFEAINMYNAKINCNADFSNSDIIKKSSFNHVYFNNNLSFLNVHFKDDFSFENIIIEKDADFRNIMFFKSLKFENVEIKGKTLPIELANDENVILKNVFINGVLIEDNQKNKKQKESKEKIKLAKEKIYKNTILDKKI